MLSAASALVRASRGTACVRFCAFATAAGGSGTPWRSVSDTRALLGGRVFSRDLARHTELAAVWASLIESTAAGPVAGPPQPHRLAGGLLLRVRQRRSVASPMLGSRGQRSILVVMSEVPRREGCDQ